MHSRAPDSVGFAVLFHHPQSLGQFDLAELCYKYVEEIHPGFEAAVERRHAARCEIKLDKQLEKQHK